MYHLKFKLQGSDKKTKLTYDEKIQILYEEIQELRADNVKLMAQVKWPWIIRILYWYWWKN